jgi:uncharacterized protein YcbX
MSLTLASIHIHPIKSLGGFTVREARLTDRGLEHDRRWMLADPAGRFLTQRELPSMACLHCAPQGDGFRVTDLRDGAHLDLPWALEQAATVRGEVWSDRVRLASSPAAWDAWFSERLGRSARLLHMPAESHRRIDGRYAEGLTSLSDGFPYLLLSQASLDELNARLATPVPMDRFRPNLVIAGGNPCQEDGWSELRIGTARFRVVKACMRCAITTTDQRTGTRSHEPLRTLAAYRARANKVPFGMYAVGDAEGVVRVGDLAVP